MRFELSLESGEQSLDVRRFAANEALSSLFRISIWARSTNPSLDLSAIVGRGAAFVVESPVPRALAPQRCWSGLCSAAEQISAEPSGLSLYRIDLVPNLWRATQRTSLRIFQHLSIPDIVVRLLAEWTITADLEIDASRYSKLEIKVQYGESDYAFICRLLEEAGITFLFEDRDRETRLVLADAPESRTQRAAPVPYFENASASGTEEVVQEIVLGRDLRSDSLVLFDYDFRRARAIRAEAFQAAGDERAERARYLPGSFLIERGAGGNTPVADDKGVARYDDGYGRERANRLLAGVRHGHAAVKLLTNAIDLRPGAVFEVSRHTHAEVEGRPLLGTDYAAEGSVEEDRFRVTLRALPADAPYLPAAVTDKPAVQGVQSAIVVGSDVGEHPEEIHVDELGRVRVQFPWDREAQANDGASCWIRVNQGWAGRGYGMVQLPRVGQEVLITFLGGDPDQPVVTGRLFDKLNPVPYKLPDNKTVSAYRSHKTPHVGDGFNEIRLEDKKGDELLYLTAEKDQRVLVKNDETHTVINNRYKGIGHNELDTTGVDRTEVTGRDRNEQVGRTRTTHIVGNRAKRVQRDKGVRNEGHRQSLVHKTEDRVVRSDKREWLQREAHLHVKGDLREAVDDRRSLIIDDEAHIDVGGSFAEASGRKSSYHADNALVGEGGGSVAVRGAGGFLAIDGGGIVIQGTIVRINAGGSAGDAQQARPTVALVARELQRPPDPPPVDDASRAEKWSGIERSFSAIASLRAGKLSELAEKGKRILSFAGQLVQQRDSLINLVRSDKLGRSSIDRMLNGLAPLGANGLPLRLARATEAGASLVETAGAATADLSRLLQVTPSSVAKTALGASGALSTASYWRARAASLSPPGAGT
jgi:type VI secretion system secreted protein VgrG